MADEVGLGKTIVASGLIEKLAAKKTAEGGGPLSVLYVCSNLAIAKQNIDRLLSFLPKNDREKAVATVDRPSLLSTRPRPTHERVHIYMLTPDTAIPTRKGQRRDGRLEERALALVLLHRILPLRIRRLYRLFQRQAGSKSFGSCVRYYRVKDDSGELGRGEFRKEFRDALRDVFGLSAGQHLLPLLNQMLDDRKDQDLVAACRTALTVAALNSMDTGLVIFDEFQRFRDLMDDVNVEDEEEDEEEAMRSRSAARVLEAIRGGTNSAGPALLLLSATPYTPYRRHSMVAAQNGSSADQSSDFFDLISFLAASPRTAKAAQEKFIELSEELRKGDFDSVRAQLIRASLMEILLPLMSRTERPIPPSERDGSVGTTSVIDADLLPSDLAQFREMHDCFSLASQDWIVPLWQSVPLSMQTLGSRYLAWTNKVKMPNRVALQKTERDGYRLSAPWPHPRVRALMAKMSEKQMAMPWAAPSLPWWPMQGGWKSSGDGSKIDGKLLVFSRYKAVPTALSGLISYTTECNLLAPKQSRSRINYEDASNRRWLQPNPERPALLELFHPCLLLAKLEPLKAPLGSYGAMKRDVERQLRLLLKDLDVKVTPHLNAARRKPWEILVALEKKAGLWDSSLMSWASMTPDVEDADEVGRLKGMINRWDEIAKQDKDITEIAAETDLQALVALAMESPGVVLLRALSRHWPDATDQKNLRLVLPVVWRGLRHYLDKSWFVAALGEPNGRNYPGAIRKAVIEGNLESVLDEHFWFLSTDGSGDWGVRLEEVEKSLRLLGARVTFHEGDELRVDGSLNESASFTIRCHVAVPLGEVRKASSSIQGQRADKDTELDKIKSLRPDEIRKAFNSPFWPNVLVTTSIGQEGLDLHPWCNSLAHWDLANSPVALEQREGRITRFGSLSVRRAIARKLQTQLKIEEGQSPWHQLAGLAEVQLSDKSGMSPWWVVEGGDCKRFFLTVPGGEQQERFESLARERALYRLVLGMPDQTDLMSLLDAQGNNPETLRSACLDLSAYNNLKSQ